MEDRVLILIPARYGSQRFPGKPLALLKGLPLILHVTKRVRDISNKITDYKIDFAVVTDNQEIFRVVDQDGSPVVMVEDETESGTDRIKLAYERHFESKDYGLIINIQGDEPLIEANDILDLIKFHLGSNYDLGTMVKEMEKEQAKSPNQVKAIWSKSTGQCLYFSRSLIPYDRDSNVEMKNYFGHIGVYSYRPKALKKMAECSKTFYEQRESLEQLRALENGLLIGAIKITSKLIGVDTPEDLKRVEEVMNETN